VRVFYSPAGVSYCSLKRAFDSHAGALKSHARVFYSHASVFFSHAGVLYSHARFFYSLAGVLYSHSGVFYSHVCVLLPQSRSPLLARARPLFAAPASSTRAREYSTRTPVLGFARKQ